MSLNAVVEKSFPIPPFEIDRRMVMLAEVARLINSSRVLDEVLRLTLEWSTRVMDAESGSVILLDCATDELVIKVATGPRSDQARNLRFPKDHGIAGWVAERGQPRIVSNVRQDTHFFDGIDQNTGYTTQSVLAVPLQIKEDHIMGVLEVLNKKDGNDFDEDDLRLFTTFADLAAIAIDNAGAYEELTAENRRLQARVALERAVIGQSPAMRQVVRQLERVARKEVSVLLCGETGTGKSLIARVLHDQSPRCNGPFITVDCGALSDGLWESELFGHQKGAFTGAAQDKQGLFEAANNGTIFLDEIGNTPLEFQTRLLYVLQEGEIRRVGETSTRKINVRLIAATNSNLEDAVHKGTFREDLFFRLNVFPITLPALRDRREDMPFLVDYLIDKLNRELDSNIEGVSPEALHMLQTYVWPGNIRELENILKRLIVMVEKGVIRPQHLNDEIDVSLPMSAAIPAAVCAPQPGLTQATDLTLEGMERRQIERALSEAAGNQSAAARLLGISREKMRYRMRKYGI